MTELEALLTSMRAELELDIQFCTHRGQHIRASQRLAQFEQLASHLTPTEQVPGAPAA